MTSGGNSSQFRDTRLWKELVQGSDQALAELMRLHFKGLLNYGFKFVKDEAFVKDCIQEVFIDLWHCRERVTEPAHVKAYLLVSLRRKIARNRRQLNSNTLAPLSDEYAFSIEFSPEWWMINEETLARKAQVISEMLDALPTRQREVIYLKYYQGLSREEISTMLDITPQTVSNLLQMAYGQIRKRFSPSVINALLFLLFY
ncbi:RNA polymerase sigma factor, sigma-70 family [Dyadobacter soli]|uniref:RNA polymerase sigma factor, sigma-70 family n=1 Tax=Dyadobacter soli TaxID=659014 RepID=A0A1G6ZP90_9BACT|nr:sigma-70 family RNA polymerase sigma factor [Dyadobacter soli]SDE03675.1 RNA polymerase sigma factor, sigma-70 family [Dyadobacter soli]